jgi:hypothetical protein
MMSLCLKNFYTAVNTTTNTIFVEDLQVLLDTLLMLHGSVYAYAIIRRYGQKTQVWYCESKHGSVFFTRSLKSIYLIGVCI